MTTEFEIDVGSDQEHEDLVAEIYYRGEFFALISQETGLSNAQIRFEPPPDGKAWVCDLAAAEAAIGLARERLAQLTLGQCATSREE